MHPAPSIVLFTVLSGSGYGLLFLMSLLGASGRLPGSPAFGLAGLGLSLALITAGLLASLFHLGHPERAWRALSQWRSSWLSREGVCALATYAPALLLALGWSVFENVWTPVALLSAAGAAATVICTAMIYASLKPVAQWNSPWTPPAFLGLSLAAGGLLLAFVMGIFAPRADWPLGLASLMLALGWALKIAYWLLAGRKRSPATPESATGLGAYGKVRLLEAPHTEENYLLKEMAFQIARKHAGDLRRLSLVLGLFAPLFLLLVASLLTVVPTAIASGLAALFGLAGILVERWLFFAEARHTVTLYYGAAEA